MMNYLGNMKLTSYNPLPDFVEVSALLAGIITPDTSATANAAKFPPSSKWLSRVIECLHEGFGLSSCKAYGLCCGTARIVTVTPPTLAG